MDPRDGVPASSGGLDYESLLLRCADKAYNFALRLAGNQSDAQDLVQEAFARAFANKDKYDPTRPMGAWLNRILHNIFLDSVRRYERRHSVSIDAPVTASGEGSWDSLLAGHDADPIDDLIKDEEERLLQNALVRLPPHYRSAVVLADIEGVPYEDIAQILGVPIGTVGSRVHQGRILLRKQLERVLLTRED